MSANSIEEPGIKTAASRAAGARVVAEVIAGPHKGEIFEFDRHATLLVGRSSQAQLCLSQDPHFSRHHCCLEVNPPAVFFRDLCSRNGTYINKQRTFERHLADGDIIWGGKTQIRISIISADPHAGTGATTFVPRVSMPADAESAPSTRSMLQPVPGYEVDAELGRGGMGIVYRAVQRSTGKRVALKVLMPAHAVTEDAMQLFIREANVLGGLNHPQIIRFHEFGMAAGQLFLAMEYIETVDPRKLFEKQSHASRIRVPCGIACQVLEALSYAHARSLIHRDIKPSNILLTRRKEKLRVKVADFGLAKNYINAGFSAMTLEGDIRGTLGYSSPEQIIDSRHAKPVCDIYSVGATLYEYIAGTSPYEFKAGRSQLVTILEGEPVPLRDRCPQVPAELAAIIHRALAKNPSDRFSSADEMRLALLPYSKRVK